MKKAVRKQSEIKKVVPEIIFKDRTEIREHFWKCYDAIPNGFGHVINYYGSGGIGKSKLCEYLHKTIHEKVHPVTGKELESKSFIFSFEGKRNNCEKVKILSDLANKFEQACKYELLYFKYALYVYYKTLGEDKAAPEIKSLGNSRLFNMLMDAASFVPVVGQIGSSVIKNADVLVAGVRELFLKNKDNIRMLDTMEAEDIEAVLVDFFVEDLWEKLSKEKAPVVVFLDAYEHMQNYAHRTESAKVSDEFLWGDTGIIRQLPNVLWVINGQRQLDWNLHDDYWDEEAIEYRQIDKLKDDDVKELLKDLEIEESEIVDIILKKTNGIPQHVSTCISTYFKLKAENKQPVAADFDKDNNGLVSRLIGGLSNEDKDMIQTFACLEKWTENDIAELNLSFDRYEYLKQLAIICRKDDVFYLDKAIQETVCRSSNLQIKKKCIEYLSFKLCDEALTRIDRNDYQLRKLKLELITLDIRKNTEHKDWELDVFFGEKLPFLRLNIYDASLFWNGISLIEGYIPKECMPQKYANILLVYKWYRCIFEGDLVTVLKESEKQNIEEIAQTLPEDAYALLYAVLAKCNYNTEFWYSYLREAFRSAHMLQDDLTRISLCMDAAEILIYNAKHVYMFMDGAEVLLQQGLNNCHKALELLESIKSSNRRNAYMCLLFTLEARIEFELGHTEEGKGLLLKADRIADKYKETESKALLEVFFKAYILEAECPVAAEDGVQYAQRALKTASKLLLIYVGRDKQSKEIQKSLIHHYNVARACRALASWLPKEDADKMRYYDNSIATLQEIYTSQKCRIYLNEWFLSVVSAFDNVAEEEKDKYISLGTNIARMDDEYWVDAQYVYRFAKSLVYHYMQLNRLAEAKDILNDLDGNLENVLRYQMPQGRYLLERVFIWEMKAYVHYYLQEDEEAYRNSLEAYHLNQLFYMQNCNEVNAKAYADWCNFLSELCIQGNAAECTLENALTYALACKQALQPLVSENIDINLLKKYVDVLDKLLYLYSAMGDTENMLLISEEYEKYAEYLTEDLYE